MADPTFGKGESFAAGAGVNEFASTMLADVPPLAAMNIPSELSPPTIQVFGNHIEGLMLNAINQLGSIDHTDIPQYKGPNSGPVLAALDKFTKEATGYKGKINAAAVDSQEAGDSVLEAVLAKAGADTNATTADAARAKQISDMAYKIGAQFGVNADSERIATKAHELADMQDQISKYRGTIMKMQSISFMEDPMGWIQAQMELPGMIEQHNVFAAKINGVESGIASSISMAERANTYAANTVPQITAEQLAAKQAQIATTAAFNANVARQQLADKRIDIASKELAGSQAAVSAENTAHGIRVAEAEREYNTSLNRLKSVETMAELRLRLLDHVLKYDDMITINKTLRNYDKVTGRPAGTTTPGALKLLPKEQQEHVLLLGQGVGAPTVADAVDMYASNGVGPLLDPVRKKFLQDMNELKIEIQNTQGFTNAGSAEARSAYVKQQLNERVGMFRNNPDSPDKRNPFRALPPAEFFAANPQYERVAGLGPLLSTIKSPTAPSTEVVLRTIAKANPDPRIAAGIISQYFKQNIMTRDSVMQYDTLGIRTGMPSYKYMDKNTSIFSFGSATPVELLNESQVYNMLLRWRKTTTLEGGDPVNPFHNN